MADGNHTENGTLTKVCGSCREPVPLIEFGKNGARLHSWCRPCLRKWQREYRKTPEYRAAFNDWQSRPEVKARAKENRKSEARAEYDRVYSRIWHQQPHIKARKLAERRTPERLEKLREYNRKYRRERSARDPVYKLRMRLSSEIARALKGKKGRSTWWQAVCGYTVSEIRAHLERQFTNAMTWENHGTVWEIDHIRPIAAFDNIVSTECADFKAAWALSNLRPLPKALNRAKSASVAHL